MSFRYTGLKAEDWIHVAQLRDQLLAVVNMNFWVP